MSMNFLSVVLFPNPRFQTAILPLNRALTTL
jgi:hypothetical protein